MPVRESSVYQLLGQAIGPAPRRAQPTHLVSIVPSGLDYDVAYEILVLVSLDRLAQAHISTVLNAISTLTSARACSLLRARRLDLPYELAAKCSTVPTAPGTYHIRSVILTPGGMLVRPAERSPGNRVLRDAFQSLTAWAVLTDPGKYLLRVTFRDSTGKLTDKGLPTARRVMEEGLTLAGHRFVFFTYTDRQLQATSAWFVSTEAPLTAAAILRELGEFNRIGSPGMYAARVRQCFSETLPGYYGEYEWRRQADVVSESGLCFTDGAGTISKQLLRTIASYLKLDRVPAALQIRVGGAKGVVVEDPSLEGMVLCTRPSMHKFESTASTIEVCLGGWSTFKSGNLNRQLITLLSSRGVPDDAFWSLHACMVALLQHLLDASKPEQPSNAMQKTLAACQWLQPTGCMLDMLRGGVDPKADRLLADMLHQLYASYWERIKDRGRIKIHESCLLMGVPTTAPSALQYGEVYLWPDSPHDHSRFPSPITGDVIVAKNPAMHPGDILVLKAVDKPELRHLRNVLVFPVEGPRPHASETSGGDLDGDEVCRDA